MIYKSSFGAKMEHLLSSRAEIIKSFDNIPAAEGHDPSKDIRDVPAVDNVGWSDDKAASVCVIAPPLETFMDVPGQIRKERFFQTVQRGDLLVGVVTSQQEAGVVVTVLAPDGGLKRDFEGLKITGFCPIRQLPRMSVDSVQINDRVRCFVLDCAPSGRLILSMNPKGMDRNTYGDVRVGVIAEEELPLHYKKLLNLDNKTFEECLESTPQFHNPDGVQVMCQRFGIPRSSICSLLYPYANLSLPKSEMGVELRRQQLRTLSMKRVAQGVKYFKDGRQTEALQCYNFAIDIEDTNPDAFVARGALYASNANYQKAIDDFEQALNFKPNHNNAKNYLGQTLVAFANE
ncbi:Tetratricopeptide repeat protein 14 [Cichlidogyrus casuarinus]|uniref:Tetratricopeptide repeat protein 14 n=1 Tax=Cichlidogyrus casuarinus TaxID=1844966 RepID=A0ABD2Q8U0_9PLAT